MEHEAQFSADVVLLVFLKWSQPVSRAKDAFVEKLSGAAQMEIPIMPTSAEDAPHGKSED